MVVCGIVVGVLVGSGFAVLVIVGAVRQHDADLAIAVGQSLVGGRGVGGVGVLCDDRAICGDIVDTVDQRASFVQRSPEVGHAIFVAPAEAIDGRALPYLVQVERQADLDDILKPVVENERAGVAVAHVVLAGLAVAVLSQNVDLRVVLGGGLLGRGLQ